MIKAIPVAWGMTALLAAGAFGNVSYSYVTDSSFYSAAPGMTVTANVYLKETLTNGSTSLLRQSAEDGLFGVAFEVQAVQNNLSSPTTISNITLNNAPGQFDIGGTFNSKSVTATTATLSEAQSLGAVDGVQLGNQPALAGSITTPANEIFLGAISFTTGSAGDATSFDLTWWRTGSTVTFKDNYDLDPSSAIYGYTGARATTTMFTIGSAPDSQPLPEPFSLAPFGTACVGLLIRRRCKSGQLQQ